MLNRTFQTILLFLLFSCCYKSVIDVTLPVKTMKYLIQVCQKLRFDNVAEECIHAVENAINIITVENWASVQNYIKEAGLSSLKPKIESWIKDNLIEIIEERNIKSLRRSQVSNMYFVLYYFW